MFICVCACFSVYVCVRFWRVIVLLLVMNSYCSKQCTFLFFKILMRVVNRISLCVRVCVCFLGSGREETIVPVY